ncbi:MAG: hypothetical protein WCC84_13680 [Candidatus Cybelea sp.]
MLGRHEGNRTVATVRDIIEIVAILAAGFWALYVFAYEQRIKPASEPPALLVTGSVHKLGEHNGLIQLGYNGSVRNIGHSEVNLIALGFVAEGLTYTGKGVPHVDRPYEGLSTYERDARVASRTVVYRTVELTKFVQKNYGGGFGLSPGAEVPYSGIVLVKAGEYDSVALYGSVAYTKVPVEAGYPTKVVRTPNDAIYFVSVNGDPDYSSIEVTLDQISLW